MGEAVPVTPELCEDCRAPLTAKRAEFSFVCLTCFEALKALWNASPDVVVKRLYGGSGG